MRFAVELSTGNRLEMLSNKKSWLICVVIGGMAPIVVGCGGSKYNAALNERLGDLKREAPFNSLSAPTEIPGTPVMIRIPKDLSRYATLDTPDSTSPTGKISPERVKFSMLKLPGVYCVYDAETPLAEPNNGSKAPMACQIAVIPKSAPEAAALPGMLDAGLKMAFPGQAVAWEPVEVDTPGGANRIKWNMIHAEPEILFDVIPADASGAIQLKKLPSVLEVWWHETDHYHVLLVWRIPKEAEEKVNLMNLAKLSAGTISVSAPPPPAEDKPKE